MSKNISEKAFKAGIWYTLSSILIQAISILATPIYTRMLSPSDYGTAYTFTSWLQILTALVTLSLVYSLGRAKLDYSNRLYNYICSIQTLSSSFAGLIFILVMIFIEPVSNTLNFDKPLVYIMFIFLIFSPSLAYAQSYYRYQYEYKQNILLSLIISVSTVVLSISLISIFDENRYYGKIFGTLIPIFVLSVYFYFKFIIKGFTFINKEYWKYALKISVPMIAHSLSMIILIQSDRIMIREYIDDTATGIYSLAYSYASLLLIVTGAINQAWLPWFYDKFNLNEFAAINKAIKPLVILGCFMAIGCIIITPEALMILGTKSYLDGKWAVPPIVIGILCQFLYSHYSNIELYLKKTSLIAVGTIIASIINVILNIIFIPKYGYMAAAYTTMISYFGLMLFHYLSTIIILKVKLYNNVFIFLALLITTLSGLGISLIFDNALLRYLLLLLILIGALYVFWKSNTIKNIILKR
ncbi:oligosaccharide flippase family protein [Aquibacillus halophilus]|uniref:Oligosaccharide flippase family protein n=1 Tax=Aquibacillus halophilus TaxID=930132 RepID=A0A6A8D618_9BACI|nr:oligosaccharide flippase family protein [Aquibacillus halophilus]MRH41215.1 oligosaccharide flippase family protein [Aquibacillus halophilus]